MSSVAILLGLEPRTSQGMKYSDAKMKIEISSPIAKTIPWNMKSSSLSFLISGTNEIFDFSSVLISVFLGRV